MTFTRTHTRVHVAVGHANPHLVCDKCRKPVRAWHDNEKCGCDETFWNEPCGCERVSVTSVCPSWSPVDGCTCTLAHISPWPVEAVADV